MSKLGKNFLLNTIYQICAIIIPLVTAPYLSRVLMANNYGIYSYVQSTAAIIQTLTLLGLYSYGNRQIAYYRDNVKKLSQIFWELMILRMIIGIFGTIVYMSISLNSNYSHYFLLYYPFYLSNIIDCSWIYMGMENIFPCVVKNIIAKIATMIGIFIFVNSPDDIGKYIFLVAMSSLICNIIVYLELRNIIFVTKIYFSNIYKHLKGSIMLFLPQIASMLYLQMDKTMLGAITGKTSMVSFYDQADKLVTIAFSLITAISTVMMPRIANEFHKGHNDRIEYYINKVGKLSLALAYPMMIGMMTIATKLVPWYLGTEYMPTANALIIISPLAVINTLIGISGNQYFIATNKITILTISNFVAAGCNLVINCILIPKFGYIGAAIATLFSSTINVAIQYVYLNRYIKIKKMLVSSFKYFFISVFMGLCIKLITNFFNLSSTPKTTFIQLIVGLIVYGGVLLILHDTVVQDICDIFNIKLKKIKKEG